MVDQMGLMSLKSLKSLKRYFPFLCIVILGGVLWARDIPTLTGPVVDEAGLLSPKEEQTISNILHQFHQQKGPQLQVLIVKSLEGDPIEDFSIRVVDQWKLGQERKDNGVLFLVAIEDRKMRIEVGRGLEGDLPDIASGRIIRNISPFFKEGQFAQGILYGVGSIMEALGGAPEGANQFAPAKGRRRAPSLLMFPLFLFLFLFASLGKAFLRATGLSRGSPWGRRGGFGGYYGGFPRGGGGGGGGWGGGGGGFSGGGASGDW